MWKTVFIGFRNVGMKNDMVKVQASLFTNGKKNNENPVFLTKYYMFMFQYCAYEWTKIF